jgi:uncharacterized Zn finger protein (UPF0148 family)
MMPVCPICKSREFVRALSIHATFSCEVCCHIWSVSKIAEKKEPNMKPMTCPVCKKETVTSSAEGKYYCPSCGWNEQIHNVPTQKPEVPNIYTTVQWETLLQSSEKKIRSLSVLKGGEYSGDSDRLANFRRNAQNLDLLPEQIWAVYAGKHWDSLMQYIKDLGTGKARTRSEPLSGRADDLIVYLLLFKAMLEERNEP